MARCRGREWQGAGEANDKVQGKRMARIRGKGWQGAAKGYGKVQGRRMSQCRVISLCRVKKDLKYDILISFVVNKLYKILYLLDL